MDALSDVLRAVRLSGAVFFDIRAAEPWVAATPPGTAIVGAMFPGAEHLISYHVIIAGSCWAGPPDAPPPSASRGNQPPTERHEARGARFEDQWPRSGSNSIHEGRCAPMIKPR